MRNLLAIVLMLIAARASSQITVDTNRYIMTVTYKVAGTEKTLSVFKSYVPGIGMRNQAVYQPSPVELGMEPEISNVKFTDEVVYIKAMLDEAQKYRAVNLSKLSINILPYIDLTARLVDLYVNSKEWNEYCTKAAAQLRRENTLMDGSVVTEPAYDIKIANTIFEKSAMLKEFSDLFAPYGYTVTSGGFPDEHQSIVSTDKLMLLKENPNLFIPVPNNYITLTKIKK